MRKLLIAALLGLMVSLPVASVAQETVPHQGSFFPMPGDRKIDGDVWISGDLYRGTAQTDWIQWYPAIYYCKSDIPSAQLVPTRIAQFDWALARTGAGAETYNIVCTLDLPTRTATSSGAKIVSVDIVYYVGTVDLTSHTFGGVRSVTYANGVADTIATFGGSLTGPTLATATSSSPSLTSITFGTPAFMNTQRRAILVEWQAVLASGTVYEVMGIALHHTRAD